MYTFVSVADFNDISDVDYFYSVTDITNFKTVSRNEYDIDIVYFAAVTDFSVKWYVIAAVDLFTSVTTFGEFSVLALYVAAFANFLFTFHVFVTAMSQMCHRC